MGWNFRDSQKAKLESMVGSKLVRDRYEFEYDKAARLTGQPYYQRPDLRPPDQHAPQAVGDKNNLQGPGYRNDTPDNWLRGRDESAEGKPAFDTMQGKQPQHRNPAEGRGRR